MTRGSPDSSGAPVILCIDDQPGPLSTRKLVLQKSGYKVLGASSGKEALRLLRDTHVDLVLSDHYLQSELGTEIAAQIKALRPNLPVLLVSGAADHLAGLSGAENVDDLISKAAGPTNLLVCIARALKL